jgi:transposase
MRGKVEEQVQFISLINVESLVGAEHPIRRIKKLVDEVLKKLSGKFEKMYSTEGRPSIPPEQLLKAKVLQALYTVRSDRQLCERMQTDLMFRWFLDLGLDKKVFDASSFSQNQRRLLEHEVADCFFKEVVKLARENKWVSDDHFSVDGTLIEAWASMKSFRPKGEPPKDGNGWSDFKGSKRKNETHQSVTDPESRLLKKSAGQEAKLCYAAHSVMENRNGLCVAFTVRQSVGEGTSEPQVAVEQLRKLKQRGWKPKTVGADKTYHCQHFVESLRRMKIKPHPALYETKDKMGIILNGGYRASQVVRKRIEEIYGWTKTIGGFRKSRYRGEARTHACGQYVVASLNLLRMAKLQGAT